MSSDLLARTAVVVVNWNGGTANLACIDSLVASGVAVDRIVFVDNASSDGVGVVCLTRFPARCVAVADGTAGLLFLALATSILCVVFVRRRGVWFARMPSRASTVRFLGCLGAMVRNQW